MRAIDADALKEDLTRFYDNEVTARKLIDEQPTIQPDNNSENPNGSDVISRQAAIDALNDIASELHERGRLDEEYIASWCAEKVEQLPTIQPKKEIAKRVLWTGWKGYRDTRYKCPNCKKPVKNDDIYCHRCGQKLMFPRISFTDYVPGEKQETIVRWDDE